MPVGRTLPHVSDSIRRPARTETTRIIQIGGAACHEGYRSCFFRRLTEDGQVEVIGERVFDPAEVYKKH